MVEPLGEGRLSASLSGEECSLTREELNLEMEGDRMVCVGRVPVLEEVAAGEIFKPDGLGRVKGGPCPVAFTFALIASYRCTISVMDVRRDPFFRNPSCGTLNPVGVLGVSDFPSETGFDTGNSKRDWGRVWDNVGAGDAVEAKVDIRLTCDTGERRPDVLLGGRGASTAPPSDERACAHCGVPSVVASGAIIERVFDECVTRSLLGLRTAGSCVASFTLSLVCTTPPPQRSTRSCTELCLPLRFRTELLPFSASLPGITPAASSGLSTSLEDFASCALSGNEYCQLPAILSGDGRIGSVVEPLVLSEAAVRPIRWRSSGRGEWGNVLVDN